MIRTTLLTLLLATLPSSLAALATQRYTSDDGEPRVGLVKMPYSGARNVAELSGGPTYLEVGGITQSLESDGVDLKPIAHVALTSDEEPQYGERRRLGLANTHLADIVARNEQEGYLSIGLLANCSSLMGMLAGLQQSDPDGRPLQVGLVFIDAHGDFNTPETSLSGMLGGMPLAVSAGLALWRLREWSGLENPVSTEHIVLGAARDLDPLETDLVEEHQLARLSTDDFRQRSPRMHEAMERLSRETDIIYVHIDMDVLDPKEVPGHPLTVADGPTSRELADALTELFRYDKVAALGIASTPYDERDPDGVSRQAAYNLIEGAVEGIRTRPAPPSTQE